MKYHQIEAFYQVMLTGSVSKAAKNLGRTQPAVSMTIATLEEQLSTILFDRHAGRITPRAEANILFEQVRPVMTQLNDIRHSFGRLASIEVPRISIISSSNAGNHLVPSAIAKIAATGQQFRLMTASAASIISEMENQRHDIALTDEGTSELPVNSALFDLEIFEVPVFAIFAEGLISKPGAVRISDLGDFPTSTLYEENRTTREIRSALRSPVVEFSSFFPMACYAVINRGVAIVDSITCSAMKELTGTKLRPEFRLVEDARPARYFLIRPRYRPRSKVSDITYAALSRALKSHEMALSRS